MYTLACSFRWAYDVDVEGKRKTSIRIFGPCFLKSDLRLSCLSTVTPPSSNISLEISLDALGSFGVPRRMVGSKSFQLLLLLPHFTFVSP